MRGTWKVLLAGLLGGVVLFFWLGFWWMSGPGMSTMNEIPGGDALVQQLDRSGMESGVYYFPAQPDDMGDKAAWERVTELAQRGPTITFMAYQAEGYDPMDMSSMLIGFILTVLAALCAAFIIAHTAAALPGYFQRVFTTTLFGAIIAFMGVMSTGTFFLYPREVMLNELANQLIGWTLAGLVIAAFTRPARVAKADATTRQA